MTRVLVRLSNLLLGFITHVPLIWHQLASCYVTSSPLTEGKKILTQLLHLVLSEALVGTDGEGGKPEFGIQDGLGDHRGVLPDELVPGIPALDHETAGEEGKEGDLETGYQELHV